MWEKFNTIRTKLKTVLYFAAILTLLAGVTPVLADYLGPNRTVTQSVGSCKVVAYKCSFVPAKNTYKYKPVSDWSCSNESKPWLSLPKSGPSCTSNTVGAKYWKKEDSSEDQTTTYPPATLDDSLQNCTLNNGWCTTLPQLALSADEPVSGYEIIAIEGTLNGQTFACPESDCVVPLDEGDNALTYWALSSWGDSSTMGSMNVKVDSELPVISGAFSGTAGTNGWYISPVSFTGSAADATSGLASFTCTLDGAALGSCTTTSVNDEGAHTLVFTALDNAGNSGIVTQNISIDTQNPTINSALHGTLGSNSWYNDAELHATASDPTPGSGLAVLEYSIDNAGWLVYPSSGVLDLPEGKHSVEVHAIDGAGHSVASSKSFWLDSIAPDLVLDPQGTLGANNWYVSDLNLVASVSDATSGVDIFEYAHNGGTWTTYMASLVLNDGSHNISFWAQDQAGLVTQVDRLYQVDTVRPQIAGSISGTPGINGWYISNVTLSASAADPLPGSGVDAFTYILDGGAETPYTSALVIPDGLHTIRLNAQDKAGLAHFTEQPLKVDTISPSVSIQTTLPNWVKGKVSLNGSTTDNGSGISKVEISTNGGGSWQPTNGTTAWSYDWDTSKDPDGSHNVIVRATDQAGLTTQQTLITAVDNHAPNIILADSWLQWQAANLDIWDHESGLSEARLEIHDPDKRWPRRVIQLDAGDFPMKFKWDRRFGDGTIAPNGNYTVLVTAIDQLGNVSQKYASVRIVIDILPAGPTATPEAYYRMFPTPGLIATPIPPALPAATPTTMVSVFGEIQPAAQIASAPAVLVAPRATPTQTGILEWLESVLIPHAESTDQTTELAPFASPSARAANIATESNILWGAAAAAMVGAVTSYALEERRKKEQAAQAPKPSNANLEERRTKIRARKMKKLEEKWAQEKAWEDARDDDFATRGTSAKIDREDREAAVDLAAQIRANNQQKADERKLAEEQKKKDERQAQLEAYYARQEQQTTATQPTEKTWWQKGLDWIDDHQTEIALGVGVVVGVAAIVLSGGVAAPLVAAAWVAGAAAVAGGTVALGTVALNSYYERDWNENLLGNILAAGVAAAAVTGAAFLFHAATYKATTYCIYNPAICGSIAPIAKLVDSGEELWLSTQLGYQTLTHDPAAADTALELHMEHIDGGMPGNSVGKELSTEAAEQLAQYGDEAIDLIKLYGDDAIPIILDHGKQGASLLQTYGNDLTSAVAEHGDEAIELFVKYDSKAVDFIKRAETLEVDPTNVLHDPPLQGQSLEGWLLGIDDLKNPVNTPLKLNLSGTEISELRRQSIQNPDSPLFSIGYGRDAEIPFGEMANKFDNHKMSFLNMPDSEWAKYENAQAYGDFWQVNSDAIEWGVEERKIFILNVDYDLATDIENPISTQRFTYAELQLIDKIDDGYTLIRNEKYSFFVPDEHLDDYKQLVPPELLQP